MNKPIRVVLADDHPLIRSGLLARLSGESDIDVVGEAANAEEAQQCCVDLGVDVLVLDIHMPGPNATETVQFLKEHRPNVRVLILTAYDDDAYVRGLTAAGIAGYLLKEEAPDTLVQALRTIMLGGAAFSQSVVTILTQPLQSTPAASDLALSDREWQLLDLLSCGWDNARVADELCLGEQTVRNYLSRLYSKLGVRSRSEAMVWARDHRQPTSLDRVW